MPRKLYILPPPEQRWLAEALTGKDLPTQALDVAAMQSRLPGTVTSKAPKPAFATQERLVFQEQLNQAHQPLGKADFENLDDESRAKKIDAQRLQDVLTALKLRPWAMIEGPTGIGKSHFLEEILPHPETRKTAHSIEEWLHSEKPSILIVEKPVFAVN